MQNAMMPERVQKKMQTQQHCTQQVETEILTAGPAAAVFTNTGDDSGYPWCQSMASSASNKVERSSGCITCKNSGIGLRMRCDEEYLIWGMTAVDHAPY